jgi:Flp pilus assembly protein TadD
MTSQWQRRELAEKMYGEAIDLVAAGESLAASAKFRESLLADPTFLDPLHGLVRALQDSGQYEQAIGAALELIALDPDDPLAHTSLSILYQHQGMVSEAEAEALKAKLLGWKHDLRQLRETSIPE